MHKIGTEQWIKYKGMQFRVRITGHKRQYGRDRYMVEPVLGKGEAVIEIKD